MSKVRSVVYITEAAMVHLKGISRNGHYTRLYVKSGGCNGVSWDIEHVTQLDSKDTKVNDHLTIENSSLFHVIGSTLDYTKSLAGNFFTLSNKNKTSCGCGKSFALS